MAKLIVSTTDCTSTPNSPECICENVGAGDCLTCMADTRCRWKKNACVHASKPMSEKKRNKIKLSKSYKVSMSKYLTFTSHFNFRVLEGRLRLL